MKTSSKKETNRNVALPGDSLSLKEFKKEIIKAQKGPFYSIEKSKKLISKWRGQSDSE